MMKRVFGILEIKSLDEDRRIIEGIASTPRVDRVGDIVEPMGAVFALPLPLLLDHDSREQVGHVDFAKPTKSGIPFKAQIRIIPEEGDAKRLVDKAWHFAKHGLRKFVSIGFKPLEDGTELIKGGGYRFTKWEWLELSMVSIAAQPEAVITQLKSIDASLLAATGHEQERTDKTPPAPRQRSIKVVKALEGKTMKKPIAEQISAFEATRSAKSAELDAIMDASAESNETLDAEQKEKYDTLESELKEIDEHLKRLRAREKSIKETAVDVEGKSIEDAGKSRGRETPRVQIKRQSPPGTDFVRLLSARFIAKEDGCTPAEAAMSRGWGDDLVNVLKVPKHILQKAAIAPATTTDSAWAGPLVTYNNMTEEFIALLRPMSIIDRIPGLRRVPFNIKVPRETGTTTAYWVGQGSPKPVSKSVFDTVTLDFAKVAGLTFQTLELMRFSRPNSEQLMINSLTKAITYLVDRDFLDPTKTAVTGVSPASITYGSTTVAATGTTGDAFRTDLRRLLVTYTMNNYSLNSLVLVMTQTQALSLSMLRNDFSVKEFPDLTKDGGSVEGIPVVTSENIVANGGSPADGAIIVALNAEDILIADDGAVDVDISTEASIQADDSPSSPTTASTVLISLWQNNLIAVRCERFVTFAKARSTSVVYITGANYR